MLTLVPYIIIALTGVFFLAHYSHKSYDIPRATLIVLSTLIWPLIYLYGISVIYIPLGVFYLLGALFGWWILVALLSSHTHIALERTLALCSGAILCIFLPPEGFKIGIMMLVIGALLNCTYAIVQNKLRYEPLKHSSNQSHLYPIGFIGNTNMLGTYLVPHIFLSLWLGYNCHPAWTLALGPILYVIYLTHCRTAILGLFIVLAFTLYTLYGLLPVLALFTLLSICLFLLFIGALTGLFPLFSSLTPIKERINYWRVALEQIRHTPIFGLGFNVFQTRVPFLQRDINERTNGRFLAFKNYECPYPQKCHSDLLQHILDGGLVGFGLICSFIYLTLSPIISNTSTHIFPLTLALISLLACGLAFHTFHIMSTNILFWFLSFSLIRLSYGGSTEITSGTPFIALFIIYLVLALRFTLKELMYDLHMQKYFIRGKTSPPLKALEWKPNSSEAHCFAAEYYYHKGNIPKIFEHSIHSLINYDGAQRYWELCSNTALSFLLSGALTLAEQYYHRALSFWPEYKGAQNGLKQLEEITKRIKTGTVIGVKHEPKTAS